MNYCMHGGGEINNHMMTNSFDAYDLWRSQGLCQFEFDIVETIDGNYIASHDFSVIGFKNLGIKDIPSLDECTEQWFIKQRLFIDEDGIGLRTMNLEDVLKLTLQPQIDYVMVDAKTFSYQSCTKLLKKISNIIEKNNINGKKIIFETYNIDMMEATKQFNNMLLWQYCYDDDMHQGNSQLTRDMGLSCIDILQDHNISIISYPWKQAVENLMVLKRLKDEKFVIYSRTRNNIFSDLLLIAGVDVNIVDHIVTRDQYLQLESYRSDYIAKYENVIKDVFKG